jgi:molecular chaperone GrpE (heat shock protein)
VARLDSLEARFHELIKMLKRPGAIDAVNISSAELTSVFDALKMRGDVDKLQRSVIALTAELEGRAAISASVEARPQENLLEWVEQTVQNASERIAKNCNKKLHAIEKEVQQLVRRTADQTREQATRQAVKTVSTTLSTVLQNLDEKISEF